MPVLLPPPWDLPPSEPWRGGSLLFSAVLVTASTWGVCLPSSSDQDSQAAISSWACCIRSWYMGHVHSVWSHCEDRFQTSWRKTNKKHNSRQDWSQLLDQRPLPSRPRKASFLFHCPWSKWSGSWQHGRQRGAGKVCGTPPSISRGREGGNKCENERIPRVRLGIAPHKEALVQSQTAWSLQQGRAGTCTSL